MTTKYFCDGCGKEMETPFEITIEGFLQRILKYQVCVECRKKLVERFEAMRMKIKESK
jgi:hypothetical protein